MAIFQEPFCSNPDFKVELVAKIEIAKKIGALGLFLPQT
jgi:hypothetical protein